MQYQIKVTFESDRKLTATELGDLLNQVAVQVEEPVTWEGDDVEYVTSKVKVGVTNANE